LDYEVIIAGGLDTWIELSVDTESGYDFVYVSRILKLVFSLVEFSVQKKNMLGALGALV